jgi:hypothetical protein
MEIAMTYIIDAKTPKGQAGQIMKNTNEVT